MYLQFRPTNWSQRDRQPDSEPGLRPERARLAPFIYVNDPVAYASIGGTTSSGYFIGSNPYNVCVYLVNPQVALGTIEAASLTGSTAALPTGLVGHFRIDVSGAYTSALNVADAEYTSTDGWATHTQGYDIDPWFLGEDFGDVQVNGNFVNWGAFAAPHAYSLSTTLSGSVNLAVFDGDSTGKRSATGTATTAAR